MNNAVFRSKEAKKVTLIGFGANAILSIVKIIAGVVGHSAAMLADGIHSLSDFVSDIVVLVGFKFTEQPEDECHNYGHDKYETFSTMIIGVILAVVGLKLFSSGAQNIYGFFKGEYLPRPGFIALWAAVASIIIKELLYRYTAKAGERINSPAVIANAWHHRSDAFSSMGTLVGIGGAILLGNRWTVLDPIASVIVSLFIMKVAAEIFTPAMNELMEKALPEEERNKVLEILDSHTEIKEYHQLRTRKIGIKSALEMHILLDETLNLKDAHDISTDIENHIKSAFDHDCIVTIHIEPYHD